MRYITRPEGGWFVELVDGTLIGWVVTSYDGFHAIAPDETAVAELLVYDSRAAAATALRRGWDTRASRQAGRTAE